MRHTYHVMIAVAAVCGLMACSSDKATSPASASRPVRLSFSTMAGTVVAPLPGVSTALNAVSGTDTLVITKAQVVLSRLELLKSAGTICGGDDSARGCEEVERSSVVVDLPTDTTVPTVFNASIPSGTYASLEARLRTVHHGDDSDGDSLLAAHPEFTGSNIRVEGTFNGTPFVYIGAVNARLELSFSPTLAVDSTGLNITIHVDPTAWFTTGLGALIDPATANSGGANESLVRSNIMASFHAFEDEGHDGEDDHGDHSGGGNSGPGSGSDG